MNKILLILTGGTIASVDKGSGLEPDLNKEEIFSFLPKNVVNTTKLKIDTKHIFNIESPDITPSQWIELASLIYNEYDNYLGFVIAHGTDTLAYTSSALTYLLQNIRKPVILTGSQIPINQFDTDGIKNLTDSIYLASETTLNGVFVVFNSEIMYGNHVTKFNSKAFDAFKSINYPILGRIYSHNDIEFYNIPNNSLKKEKYFGSLDENILVYKLYPGVGTELLLNSYKNYSAVILEGYGLAGIPNNFIETIKIITNENKIVVFKSSVLNQGTDLNRYTVGKYLTENTNIIESKKLTFEATLTKLMYSLARSNSVEEIKNIFNESIQFDI